MFTFITVASGLIPVSSHLPPVESQDEILTTSEHMQMKISFKLTSVQYNTVHGNMYCKLNSIQILLEQRWGTLVKHCCLCLLLDGDVSARNQQ